MEQTNKREPTRTCVGCRRRFPQGALFRFVRRGDVAEPYWEPDGSPARRPGRGAYLCSNPCARRVRKNRRYPGLADAGEASIAAERAETLPGAHRRV